MIDLRFLATGVLTLSLTFSAYCSDNGKEEADDFLAQNRHGMEEVVQLDDEILIELGEPEGAQFNLSYRINAAKSGPLSRAETGPLFGLTLMSIKVGDTFWVRSHLGESSIQFERRKQKLNIIHEQDNKGEPTYNLRLTPQMLGLVKKPNYDPKDGSLQNFVKKLRDEKSSFQQEFVSDGFDVAGLGEVKLIFKRDRQVRYSEPDENDDLLKKGYLLKHDDKFNKSVFCVPFGFDGEKHTSYHEIYSMRHVEQRKIDHPNIWYLGEDLKLGEVSTIEYNMVPDDLEEWTKRNDLKNLKYSKLAHFPKHQVIKWPYEGEMNLIPEGDALKKYYRFSHGWDDEYHVKFLYADDHKNLFEAMSMTWMCLQLEHLQVESKDVFKDNFDIGHKFINLLRMLNPIVLPQLKGPNQFIESQEFYGGWYRLAEDGIIDNALNDTPNVNQTWIAEPSQERLVTVRISGILKAGKWEPLSSLHGLSPVEENNKIVLDLSNHLQGMDETKTDELKNYLQTIFWIKRIEPVIKFIKANMTAEESKTIAANLSKLINSTKCIQLDLAAGFFLTQYESGGWGLKMLTDFVNRSRADNSDWHLALDWEGLRGLIENKKMDTLDLREGSVLGYAPILGCLADLEQIEKIGLKEFNSRQLKTLGLKDNQIIKLATKAWGLEKLELINLPKLTEDSKFIYGLRGNVDTLKHLDLSGTKGLETLGNQFFAAVRLMQCLEHLNVMKADFSISQMVDLLKTLECKMSLKEVKLTMPYVRSSGLLMISGVLKDIKEDFLQANWLGKLKGLASSPILVPCVVYSLGIAGTVCTLSDALTGAHLLKDDPTILACMSLAKIPNLTSMELQLKGFRDHRVAIEEMVKYGREVLFKNTNPIQLTFSK